MLDEMLRKFHTAKQQPNDEPKVHRTPPLVSELEATAAASTSSPKKINVYLTEYIQFVPRPRGSLL